MLREEPEGGNELAGFISKFPESQKLEMYALFALSGESMTKAINTSPFTSFLVLLMDKNTPGKTRAALFTSRGAVTNFGASTAREWRLEVGAASAWTPPVEFNPFYEFQVF
jgi:hypothetical protein